MIVSKVYNYYEEEFDKVYQPSYPPYESKAVAILTAFGKEKHKLVIIQLPVGDDIMIGVETLLCHESGQFISNKMQTNIESSKRINLYQSAGTAITYYRRYSIMALLNLASGEDTDGSLEQESVPKKQPQKQFTPQPKIVSNGVVENNNTDIMGDDF
jgi:hypothetical protein